MILDVVIPNVAESITEVTLGTWLVKDGDYVTIDQPLCEVETDKASQELIAEKAGQIKLIVSEGDDVKVGGAAVLDGVNRHLEPLLVVPVFQSLERSRAVAK